MHVHLGLLLKGYFSNKHQESTQATHVSSAPLSLTQFSSSAVQTDFEPTKEEKTVLTQMPDQLEVGCVINITKNLFPGDLSSPTSSYCSLHVRHTAWNMQEC